MLGDGLRHDIGPVTRGLDQPGRHRQVESCALGTRQGCIAGVAQQRVSVRVRLTRDGVFERAGEEGASTERIEPVAGIGQVECVECSNRQSTPRHRTSAGDESGVGRQVIELRGVDGLHGPRQGHRVGPGSEPPGVALAHERSDAHPGPQQLFDKERRPIRSLDDRVHQLLRQRVADQGAHERGGVADGKGCQVDA